MTTIDTTRRSTAIAVLSAVVAFASGCRPAVPAPACSEIDPVLAASSFVLVSAPAAGARVTAPFQVTGCSRTNESNVVWELKGADGRPLAAGYTSGGGFDGPAAFEFSVEFSVSEATAARVEVYAPDDSDGEGFPPPRTILALVLAPSSNE